MADKDTIQMIRKDITERLRDRDNHDCIEAANEIERLRKELDTRISTCDMRSEKIIELTNERDEARRERDDARRDVCEYTALLNSRASMEEVAEQRGWDCFKENTDAGQDT